jgi:hypothetical protein
LKRAIPGFVALLLNHRPPALRGRSLKEVLAAEALRPARLRAAFRAVRSQPTRLREFAPVRAFAIIGQARADGVLTPEAESRLLDSILTSWALQGALGRSAGSASGGVRPQALRELAHISNRQFVLSFA